MYFFQVLYINSLEWLRLILFKIWKGFWDLEIILCKNHGKNLGQKEAFERVKNGFVFPPSIDIETNRDVARWRVIFLAVRRFRFKKWRRLFCLYGWWPAEGGLFFYIKHKWTFIMTWIDILSSRFSAPVEPTISASSGSFVPGREAILGNFPVELKKSFDNHHSCQCLLSFLNIHFNATAGFRFVLCFTTWNSSTSLLLTVSKQPIRSFQTAALEWFPLV